MGYIFSIFRSVSFGGLFGSGTNESNRVKKIKLPNYQNDFPKTWDLPAFYENVCFKRLCLSPSVITLVFILANCLPTHSALHLL